MIHKDEIYKAMQFMQENRPFQEMNEIQMHEKGIGATIMFLFKAQSDVKSVDISNYLGISSARMVVILKKLEHKNIIIKSTSSTDSRAITITLTEYGRDIAKRIEQHMFDTLVKVIEEIGLDEFYKTFESLGKIKRILHENKPDVMEVLHD